MKHSAFFLFLFSVFFQSCSEPESPILKDPVIDSFISGNGVFIINEGNFRLGNGSLSFYSYDSSKIYNNVFLAINNRPLGDVPNSMEIYGNMGYIIVNNSGVIEVVERTTLQSVASINNLNSPRNIAFIDNTKAYVTSMYSDNIIILNLKTNSVSGYINIGRSSESIIIVGKKAFVSTWIGGNKIAVINTETDELIGSIEVAIEPESMVLDKNGILWVLCNGGWMRENFAELLGINSQTNEIVKRFVFPSKMDSPTSLQINGEKDMLFFLKNGVCKMSINATEIPSVPFISEAERFFYKLGINPVNGDILVTDAVDYQQNGFVIFFSLNGLQRASYPTKIIPGSMCFKVQPDPVIQ